jgi:hypothetical protein
VLREKERKTERKAYVPHKYKHKYTKGKSLRALFED